MSAQKLIDRIGKDVYLKIADSDVRVHWKDWLKMDWRFTDVAQEFRSNPLSQIDQNYIVFTSRSGGNRCMCYDNVKDYKAYISKMLVRGNTLSEIVNYDFIVVWDKQNEKILPVFEVDENGAVLTFDQGLQEYLGVSEQIRKLMNK